jgi:two-component system KDP operon response regulator KdpE
VKVLVVDDEPQILRALAINLRARRYDVHTAATGEQALTVAAATNPDLVVLDLGLPDLDGVEVVRGLRGWSVAPIVILSGRSDSVDKVAALDAGADDYVTKPFSVRELLGRVRAQLRRRELDRSPLAQAVKIEAGPVSIDLVRHVATVRSLPVNLTRSEFQLLRLLVGRPGEVFARAQIMEELWQTEFDGDERACDVHISNLRQKVERDPQRPELVLTVRGIGYKFSPDGS